MAQLNFGGVIENVMTREEFPLEKAREVLKNETIAVIGYGVQGPGQSLNLRDNGFNVIVGQRQGKTYDKAVAEADQVRNDAIDDLNVGASGLDWEYYNYLIDKVNEAGEVLNDAISKVDANDLRWYDNTTVRYETTNGLYATFWTPDYLTEATLEGNVFVSPKVEDIIDPEWFYNNELYSVARNMLTVGLNGYAYGYDVDGNWQNKDSYFTYYLTDYDGFPLAMPEAEKYLELTVENVKKQSRFHPRCGTSFMFLMILLGIFAGMFLSQPVKV